MKHAKISKPSEAFEIIRSLLSQSTANTEITLPCIQEPVKRRKLDRMLPAVNASAACKHCRPRIRQFVRQQRKETRRLCELCGMSVVAEYLRSTATMSRAASPRRTTTRHSSYHR
ncbi:hypothetical protein GQ600_15644 [Phytophthora cactorum]|nr:hypothetical protein GQ600_15644 [Phytophthora cactorum]